MGALVDILGVSFLTLISRVSGLVRDIFIFSAFGISELNSAFLFAFSIPNLFRRLLGEGALASALIPVFSDEYHKNGKEEAFFLLNRVISRLILILLLIVGGGMAICGLGYSGGGLSDRWRLCFMFSALLLPYVFFVCLGALLAAVLNIFGKFLLHASNSIWLNLAMIGALWVGYFFHESWRIYWLCAGVFVGGVIQLWALWVGLGRMGWRFRFDWESDGRVREVWRLFFPGVAGASVQQVNEVISRVLAYAVSSRAVSVLYLANRLVELPLGLFVTAVSTVIFPRLSRLEARGERALLREEFRRGMDLILVIIFPAALGMLSLDRTLLNLLFLWGNFTERDVALVLPVLRIFLVALPFYALSTHFLRGYYCKKDMVRPMVIAAIHFGVNVFLALGLMHWLETVGIAIANLLSIIVQTILLYWGLRRLGEAFCIRIWTRRLGSIILASILMAAAVKLSDYILGLYLLGKVCDVVSMGVNIPLGVMVYFGLLYVLDGRKRLSDLGMIWRRFVKKIKN